MYFLLVLCLKLSLLHLCVSDLGYECNDAYYSRNKIYLINDGGTKFTIPFNNRFREICQSFYDIEGVSLEYYNERLSTTDNVIRFAVPDDWNDELMNDFVYAGTTDKTDDPQCHKTNKAKPEVDCNKEIVHLVSKSVKELNDGHIYNLIQKIRGLQLSETESCKPFFNKTTDLTTVLLCLAEEDDVKIQLTQPLKLKQVKKRYCSNNFDYHSDLLAVLAPGPFDVPSESTVPTIFYETPYMYSKYKAAFPNSMNLVPWRLLKYGFLKFIQTVGWERVVVVTDDSEYSIDFEGELTALFSKEGLIYTVIRCEDANCDMNKIKQELNKVAARIVIANVEEDHARNLFENIPHLKIQWIVRDMAGKKLTENLDVFSISLRTVSTNNDCGVDDNILTGLRNIAQAHKKIPGKDYELKRREFYRHVADRAKYISSRATEAIVIVEKLHNHGSEEISKMHVNAAGAELITFKNPFKSGVPSDGTGYCLAKSYDYFKPCEDTITLLLLCVLLVFVTTILLITYFFDKTSPVNDGRYQHF